MQIIFLIIIAGIVTLGSINEHKKSTKKKTACGVVYGGQVDEKCELETK